MEYLKLLSALVTSDYMPKQQLTTEVVGSDWNYVKCSKAVVTSDDVVIYPWAGGAYITKIPFDNLRALRYTDTIEYPELLPAQQVPDKTDLLGWVLASVRASLNDVNRVSDSLCDRSLVLSVDLNHELNCLQVVMSSLWPAVDVNVRHHFINALWVKLKALVNGYGADPAYNRVYVYPWDDTEEIIGYRTTTGMKVVDGPLVIYKQQ